MNIEDPRHPWQRLARAARQAPADDALEAPSGFATRVAAEAMAAQSDETRVFFTRFSRRALLVAAVLAIACIALNFSRLKPAAPGGEPLDQLRAYRERLDLTVAQDQKIQPLMEKAADELARIREAELAQTRQIILQLEKSFRSELTSAQAAKMDQIETEQKRRGGGPRGSFRGDGRPSRDSTK